jgi:hypothetical protein
MFALTGTPLKVKIPGTKIVIGDEGDGPFDKREAGPSTAQLIHLVANLDDATFKEFVDSILEDRNIMNELSGSDKIPTVVWAAEVFLEDYIRTIAFPKLVARVRRVQFPLFNLKCNPEIPLAQINSRRFDLVERSMGLAQQSLDHANEKDILDVLLQNQDALNNGNPISGSDLLPNRVKTAMQNIF